MVNNGLVPSPPEADRGARPERTKRIEGYEDAKKALPVV